MITNKPVRIAIIAPIAPPTRWATNPKMSINTPPVFAFLIPILIIRAAPKIKIPRTPRMLALTMPVKLLIGFSKTSGT